MDSVKQFAAVICFFFSDCRYMTFYKRSDLQQKDYDAAWLRFMQVCNDLDN